MPFQIVRNDITDMRVDAIVNTANPKPLIGFGVDSGIHKKAGPRLLSARKAIGKLSVGQAAITPGFDLNARFVIHTVAPVWHGGGRDEEALLYKCYRESLLLALGSGCSSIAFPLIASGNNGFPKDLALRTAANAIREFLAEAEMDVYLVVFDREAFRLSESLSRDVKSFIDENYILLKNLEEYGVSGRGDADRQEYQRRAQARQSAQASEAATPPKRSAPKSRGWGPWRMNQKLPADERREVAAEAEYRRRVEPRDTVSPPAKDGDSGIPINEAPTMPAPAPYMPRTVSAFDGPGSSAPVSLEDMLRQTDEGFSQRLLRLIDQTGKKDSEIYTKANVSRQHFSKIRNNPYYKPTKATALAFAIALELDMEQTQDLIGRAGYVLTRSSKFDLIIMYFIQNRNYNMFDINATLFQFDQSLLGA